ncbi:MAG: translation initiation factor IF-3 [Deltaproteobacteria bacterium]|nr:translation initiation factor IF-3 [Deltaproteobacteria bacterium]
MIRAAKLRIVDEAGNQLGVMNSDEAIAMAEDMGLDLVEVSPNADPPVCRIMDYGKYKYQLSKKAHEAKKKQTIIHVKEVKLRGKTEEHDFQFKLKNARKFLNQGDKLKVTIFFRGREMARRDLGLKMLERVAEAVKDIGVVEQRPKIEGRSMFILVSPLIQKSKLNEAALKAKELEKDKNTENKKPVKSEKKVEEKIETVPEQGASSSEEES